MQPGLDYSQLTANLYVGKTPHGADYNILYERGVRLAINMRIEHVAWPPHGHSAMSILWVPTIDHWLFPIFPWYVRRAVQQALHVMESGGSVYCFCMQGRHRSVLMAACILIAQGHSVEQAVAILKGARAVADPEVPYIYRSIRAFAAGWQRTVR